MNIETMCKHQHVAFFKVRFNVFLVHICLQFIVDQDHDDICLLCSFCCCINLEALFFRSLPRFASFIKSDDDITSGFFQVQSVCMSLASVSDNCDLLSFQYG